MPTAPGACVHQFISTLHPYRAHARCRALHQEPQLRPVDPNRDQAWPTLLIQPSPPPGPRPPSPWPSEPIKYMAVGQNQWYHFRVGAPLILVYFGGTCVGYLLYRQLGLAVSLCRHPSLKTTSTPNSPFLRFQKNWKASKKWHVPKVGRANTGSKQNLFETRSLGSKAGPAFAITPKQSSWARIFTNGPKNEETAAIPAGIKLKESLLRRGLGSQDPG